MSWSSVHAWPRLLVPGNAKHAGRSCEHPSASLDLPQQLDCSLMGMLPVQHHHYIAGSTISAGNEGDRRKQQQPASTEQLLLLFSKSWKCTHGGMDRTAVSMQVVLLYVRRLQRQLPHRAHLGVDDDASSMHHCIAMRRASAGELCGQPTSPARAALQVDHDASCAHPPRGGCCPSGSMI